VKLKSKFLIFFIFSLLFVTVGSLSCQSQATSGDVKSAAPDFTLKDLDGQPFRLSDTKGKVVILDFWATWCPPCRMELPHFESLYREYKDKGLVIIGVSLDRGGAAAVKPFVETNEISYTILIGDQRITALYGGIRGIPTTFVIDRRGHIVEKFVGYRSKEVFESLIKKLL
jgi:peroxiredoxin